MVEKNAEELSMLRHALEVFSDYHHQTRYAVKNSLTITLMNLMHHEGDVARAYQLGWQSMLTISSEILICTSVQAPFQAKT